MRHTHQQSASGTSRDIRCIEEVTAHIVAELEKGCVPWVQPWQFRRIAWPAAKRRQP